MGSREKESKDKGSMSACLKEVYTAQRDRMNVEGTDRMDTRVGRRGGGERLLVYATTKTRNDK
jgi:hypothetical protein